MAPGVQFGLGPPLAAELPVKVTVRFGQLDHDFLFLRLGAALGSGGE